MRTAIAAFVVGILLAPGAAFAQRGRGPRPPVSTRQRDSDAVRRVTWRTRTLVGDNRLLQWRTGFPASLYRRRSFVDAAFRADAMGLTVIEASNTQRATSQIAKNLDYNLTPAELIVVQADLRAAAVEVAAYSVDRLPGEAASRRRMFEFAKQLGARMIVTEAAASDLADLDKLASEVGVDVALRGDPKGLMAALQTRSARTGVAVDTGEWLRSGVKPIDGLAMVRDRLKMVYLRDRNGLGEEGEAALIGAGAAEMGKFFAEMNRLNIRPLYMSLDMARGLDPDIELPLTIDAFEATVQPTLAAFIVAASKSMAIRSGDNLPPDVKAKIDAAIPRKPYVAPKKPRKLLVMDACVANSAHNTIAHFNLAVALMAKHTGAFEAVFSNDLANLMWPKIKEWDAILLNDNVGELFPDFTIRENVLRYVREGGGMAGWHGSGWVSRSWREIGELFSVMDGPHRIVPAYIKLDDPRSPINQAFGGISLEHAEEYYIFREDGYAAFYTRDKLHVLLSLDTSRSPGLFTPGRSGESTYVRPDQDFPVAWIKKYGKGRVYYNSMGHMPETMMSKQIMGHVFAAIQFLVGDMEADTTPNPLAFSNE